jgi:hypothetical protein
MEPKAFKYLMAVQKERDDAALTRMVTGEEEEQQQQEETLHPGREKTEEEKRREGLTKILEVSRLDIQVSGRPLLFKSLVVFCTGLEFYHKMSCEREFTNSQ